MAVLKVLANGNASEYAGILYVNESDRRCMSKHRHNDYPKNKIINKNVVGRKCDVVDEAVSASVSYVLLHSTI